MAETQPELPREPPDHHIYNWVMFGRDTLVFFLAAVKFYEALLDEDIRSVQSDPELAAFLDQEALESYAVGRELRGTRQIREWLEHHIARTADSKVPFVDLSSVVHEVVRFLKSVERLYLAHLRRKRDEIASRPTTSKALLEALDQQLARFAEKAGQGIFSRATPYPLVIEQLPSSTTQPTPTSGSAPAIPFEPAPRPRAVVLESIEIRDPELRRRCLDLLAQFRQDGEHDRLDTVVSEATRILEDRLRALAGADASCTGVDLATFAFATRQPGPRLNVGDVVAEQEAAHLLYRGIFGFVRNSAHHRLLGELQPERVLQIVGMIDYVISVAEAARRNPSNS